MTRYPSLAASARLAGLESRVTLAVVDGNIRWSWAELDERAEAVAANLARAGVRPGARVAMSAASSAAAIAALHGVARVGAALVPLGIGLRARELAIAIEVTDPGLVIVGPGLEPMATDLGCPVVRLEDLLDAGARPETPEPGASEPDLAAPAVVVLSSGTTGRPKALVLSTAALVASAQAWLSALPPATGWLLALGLDHVAGLGVVWRAALSGVPLVMVSSRDAAPIIAALQHDPAPSHVSVVPTTLARLLDVVADGPPPATLRAVLTGGGPIPADLIARACAAGWPVVPTYGLSEAGSGVTALPSTEATHNPGTAGRPLPGVRIRIADPDPAGEGEILVDSPALFSEYLGDPDATAAALTDDGWLRTGDIGRLDPDGRLTVIDRRTDRIVRGGENISPAEVEAVLESHPSVAEVAVVARRDPTFGHVPVATIVVRPDGPDPGDEALTTFCRERLAGYKVPVAFTRVEALPRTKSGKIKRAELRARTVPVAFTTTGSGPVPILLLHGTLSTAAQLGGLARALAATGDVTVHAVDRRGSGDSRMTDPTPLDVAVHVQDLADVLDEVGAPAAVLVGVSYGAVVALEFAARRPDRALAIVAYEPPYGAVADPATQQAFASIAAATEQSFASGGEPAAAEAFLRGVAGQDSWHRLPERTRAFLAAEGGGAVVDAALPGLEPARLANITAPVTLLTGGASEPFYEPIATALCQRIPGASIVRLPGATHASPITDPARIAEAVIDALRAARILPNVPQRTMLAKESRP
jgi:o-succinylbenzoate---CoA ligase